MNPMIYIGRAGHEQDGYFGNPFTDGTRDNIIDRYREYFYKKIKTDPQFAVRIEVLRGKKLGCFCKPKPCHGDIIAYYLDHRTKIVVCGSRKWKSQDIIYERFKYLPINSIIIEGGCQGADLITKHIAMIDIGLEVIEFPACWKKYGKAAGPMRNIKMLNTKPDLVIAFHNDLKKSRGTKHIVEEAKKRGIVVEVIDNSGRVDIQWPNGINYICNMKVDTHECC